MNASNSPDVAASALTLAEAAQRYLAAYTARDTYRLQRIGAWIRLLGDRPLQSITADDVDRGLSTLASEPAKVYAGRDADGNTIRWSQASAPATAQPRSASSAEHGSSPNAYLRGRRQARIRESQK